jgi:hypothetical protein
MVLTVSFVLFPVIGLSCHRHLADIGFVCARSGRKTSARLDAGVEASEPHDFAVRVSISRQRAVRSLTGLHPPCDHLARKTLPRPPHPTPRP